MTLMSRWLGCLASADEALSETRKQAASAPVEDGKICCSRRGNTQGTVRLLAAAARRLRTDSAKGELLQGARLTTILARLDFVPGSSALLEGSLIV